MSAPRARATTGSRRAHVDRRTQRLFACNVRKEGEAEWSALGDAEGSVAMPGFASRRRQLCIRGRHRTQRELFTIVARQSAGRSAYPVPPRQ